MDSSRLEIVEQVVAVPEEEAEEYWTEQRMADAKPLPMPVVPGVPEDEIERVLGEGDVVSEKPVPPAGEVEAEAEEGECFSTSRVGNMNVFPYCAVGKLYMTFSSGNFWGSAWVIGKSSVFTAGHCVFDRGGGGWAQNIKFVPRSNAHTAPNGIGSWYASRFCSLTGWTNNGAWTSDMGCFLTSKPIMPSTGGLGWMANSMASYGSPFDSIGYPAVSQGAAYPFDGLEMWHSVGQEWFALFGFPWFDSNPIIMCNNMTGGCSGGPWVIQGGYAKGVNSHKSGELSSEVRSPKFGSGFLALVDWIKGQGAYR